MLSVVVSVLTLLTMWLVARKDWRGWAVGLANQALWLALIVTTRSWGLLLLTGTLTVLYARTLLTWRRDAITPEAQP